ncbi:MAG: nucleotidyltransferase domain-containing protein [Nitrospirae bacterium]|nr:nucleotidyltransferase domain-containing protein [Nitrospirota bacterium]
MYIHEKETLKRIIELFKDEFHERIISVYAFGSRVRRNQGEWSDFDILVVVKDKDPEIESELMSIIVDEEIKSGLSFTPVIKDLKAFEMEKKFKTPFYENIIREGVLL